MLLDVSFDTQNLMLISVFLYFAFMIGIGIWSSRTRKGFAIGSRNVGVIPTVGSLASGLRDGLGIVFWFGFGAATGYGGLWMFLGGLFSFSAFAFFGPLVRKRAKEKGYITVGEMLREQYGEKTERLGALIAIFFAFILVAVQLNVSGTVFSVILGMDAWVGIYSVSLVVGFYLFFGGYNTVVKTDAIQFFIILIFSSVPFFFRPPMEEVTNFSSFVELDFQTALGLFLIGIFLVPGSADVWQRVFSARSDKVIRYSFPLAGVAMTIMTVSLIFLGLASAPFMGDEIQAENAFFKIFAYDFIPPALLCVIVVATMAVCMSSLDTYCYVIASALGRNIAPRKWTDTSDKYVRLSRIVMIVVLLLTAVLAQTISNVIMVAFQAASLLFVLAPVYLSAVFDSSKNRSKKKDLMMCASILLTSALYVVLFFSGAFESLLVITVPALCSTVLVLGVLWITRNESADVL